jgi:voltage-gated potassium channel
VARGHGRLHSEVVRLPGGRLGPLATLATRVAVAAGAIAFVALIAYVQRKGYSDAAEDGISLLDAFYYASVSVTTTGYGDITPRSDSARLVNVLVVTPVRILFLVLLVGTTVETLSGRSRHVLRVVNWSRHMKGHIVVCGYGTKGRSAIASLEGKEVERDRIVVVDPALDSVESATEDGYAAVHGDAASAAVLRRAHIADARAVVVAADRDDAAVLITLTARELNPTATIVAAVREGENAHLLRQSGTDSVITSSEAAGRMLCLATLDPAAVQVLEDLLSAGEGLDIIERPVPEDAVGRSPDAGPGRLVMAVVRDGEVLRFDDERAQTTRTGDRLVCLCARGGHD